LLLRVEYLHYDIGTQLALANPPFADAVEGDFIKFDDVDVVRIGQCVSLNGGE